MFLAILAGLPNTNTQSGICIPASIFAFAPITLKLPISTFPSMVQLLARSELFPTFVHCITTPCPILTSCPIETPFPRNPRIIEPSWIQQLFPIVTFPESPQIIAPSNISTPSPISTSPAT